MMSQDGLRSAELIKLGSRIRERYLLKTPSSVAPELLLYELRSRLVSDGARVSSYREAQPQLRQFLEQLTRYLGLIGLTALFIGGLGVATSVHAFVREKFRRSPFSRRWAPIRPPSFGHISRKPYCWA